jgi:hypothetical protein
MLDANHKDWLMRDATIITLAYLGVCVVVTLGLVVCILAGHNGILIKALIGVAIAVFGSNLWALIRSKRK